MGGSNFLRQRRRFSGAAGWIHGKGNRDSAAWALADAKIKKNQEQRESPDIIAASVKIHDLTEPE